MRRPTWRNALLGGLLLGLIGVVLIRIGVALLVGGVRVLAVLGIAGILWLVLHRLRPRG